MLTYDLNESIRNLIEHYTKYNTVTDDLMDNLMNDYCVYIVNQKFSDTEVASDVDVVMSAQVNDTF